MHSGAKTTSHPTLFDGLENYLTHGVEEDEHFLAHSVSTIAEESGGALAFSVLCLHLLCVLISLVQSALSPQKYSATTSARELLSTPPSFKARSTSSMAAELRREQRSVMKRKKSTQ